MAFGLSPRHIQNYPLDNLNKQHFLVLAIEALKKLDWNIRDISETGLIANTKLSMASYGEEVEVIIESEAAIIRSECTGNPILDWGKNRKNVESFIHTLTELKASFSEEQLDEKYQELVRRLVSAGEESLSQPPPTTTESVSSFFSIFVPRAGYYITPILINLNIAVFVLMVMSGAGIMMPESESLIRWGANFKPLTLEGEWWRLISSCFIHIGILHLLMNVYALLYIGVLLEPYLGRTRFFAAYLLTGIAASLTSLWWHDLSVSAGASGAIFGMYGVFLAMLTTNLIQKSTRQALLTSIGVFVAFNLMNGMNGGVDNAAHLGGLVSGLFIGYAYLPSLKRPDAAHLKYSTVAVIAVLILSTSFVVYGRLPNDIAKYQHKMKEFSMMEERALKIYDITDSTPTRVVLAQIRDTGLYYWKKNIELVKEANQLNVPEGLHRRNKRLTEYCALRIESYELLYKTYYENTNKYKSALDSCNKLITEAIDDLK